MEKLLEEKVKLQRPERGGQFGLTSFLLIAGVSFSRTCGPERSLCSMINWPARFNMMLSAVQAFHRHTKQMQKCDTPPTCLWLKLSFWFLRYLLWGFQRDPCLCAHRRESDRDHQRWVRNVPRHRHLLEQLHTG